MAWQVGEDAPTTVLQLGVFRKKLASSELGKSLFELPSHLRALAIVSVTEGPWEAWLGAQLCHRPTVDVVGFFLSGI